jgi:hypothetical protein
MLICGLAPNNLLVITITTGNEKNFRTATILLLHFLPIHFDSSLEDQKSSEDIKVPPVKFSLPQCCYF